VDHLRREKALGPSRYTGAASHSCQQEKFEFERPYFGPSHVVEGGGDKFKPFYSENQVIELPTESRKSELKRRISKIVQEMIHDNRVYSLLWKVRGLPSGPGRSKIIKKFWQSYGRSQSGDLNQEDPPMPDQISLAIKSFALYDFLEAQDELYTLEHPMRPPSNVRSWGSLWSRRIKQPLVAGISLHGITLFLSAFLEVPCFR
jgi:hypothetical protein